MDRIERKNDISHREIGGEKISDLELGNLLAAVGNHEVKALTLLAMKEGEIYSRDRLHQRLLEIQGLRPGWSIGKTTPFDYCRYSLSPIGLVAQEVVDQWQNIYGYTKTRYGEDLGIPFAGLMLRLSEKYLSYSLYQVFANTMSKYPNKDKHNEDKTEQQNKKRAPITRLKIFQQLLQYPSGPIREVDLAKLIGEDVSMVRRHLDNLSRNGIITFISTRVDTEYTRYILNPDHHSEPPSSKGYHGIRVPLTQFVYLTVTEQSGKAFTVNMLVDKYINEHGIEGDRKSIRKTISNILGRLRNQGYIKWEGVLHEGNQSQIYLSDTQRTFLRDIVSTMVQFQVRDEAFLANARQYAQELLLHPERVARLFEKAKEASSNANQKASQETASLILSLIRNNPRCTSKDLQTMLLQTFRKKISKIRINNLLGLLLESDQVAIVEKKGAKYYRAKG